jgi:hypothetical protein
MKELPKGFSFKKTRGGLTAILDENDKAVLYAYNEETALRCLPCAERFGGVGPARKNEKYVEL